MLNIRTKLPPRYRTQEALSRALPVARRIIAAVRREGDEAVLRYARQFDSITSDKLEIPSREINEACKDVGSRVRGLLRSVISRVRDFSRVQRVALRKIRHAKNGVNLEQRILPVQRAGVYVPGGRYPLASTAIMGVVPAKVAGVGEIIVCTPDANPVTIAAAKLAGADRVFRIGGAQAIAAMGIGTRMVPRVDVIVGPGNAYVTAAKKELYGEVGIDFVAGPTELTVVADSSAPASLVAADVLAQAEHDPDAVILVITDKRDWARSLNEQLKSQIDHLPTAKTTRKTLRRNVILVAASIADAVDIVNEVAPEHCQLMVRRPRAVADKIVNCGTLLIGPCSSCALSDYSTGANHILPTALAARYSGGLSVHTFLKSVTIQRVSGRGARLIAPIAAEMAQLEGLEAHKRAAELRNPDN